MGEGLSDFFSLVSGEKKKIKEQKETEEKYISELIDAENVINEIFNLKQKDQPPTEVDELVLVEDLNYEINEVVEQDNNERNLVQESLSKLEGQEKTKDPLTPLNQGFVTFKDLQEHYKIFLNRIQQQLASLGGGGETRLEFLDDVNRDSVKTDGKYLQYESSTGKFIGTHAGNLNTTLSISNTTTYGMSVGVITATAINAPLYVDESEDDNNNYNIPFLDTVAGGDGYRVIQVDNGGLQFNPGLNALVVANLLATNLFGNGANITGLQIPGPYADDTAAQAAGVAVGSPYYRATGQVYVRVS